MKTNKILTVTICLVIAAILAAFVAQDKIKAKRIANADGKGFAVLELFTSEGCSSCPPADELMAEIQKEAKGKAVYILAYHVDYWNNQDWKDSFSSAEYSKRQVQYGDWLNQPQIYTPQLIINGKAGYVGSDESAIRGAILRELATKPEGTLTLQTYQDNEKLQVQYKAAKTKHGSNLLIAIIQKAAQSKVEGGENAGLTLSHVQIVRALQSEPITATGSGNATIILPKDFNIQGWEVVGLVQDQSNGKILGVAKANLNNK